MGLILNFYRAIAGNYCLNFIQNELPVLMEEVPFQFKHEATTWCCTSFRLANNRILELLLWISFHLTPLDFFFWGYMKELVYQEESQTRDKLL
jgi:hypothetical protein